MTPGGLPLPASIFQAHDRKSTRSGSIGNWLQSHWPPNRPPNSSRLDVQRTQQRQEPHAAATRSIFQLSGAINELRTSV